MALSRQNLVQKHAKITLMVKLVLNSPRICLFTHVSLFESTSPQIIRCYLRLNIKAGMHKYFLNSGGTQIICRCLVLNQSCSVSGVVKEYRQNGIASFMLENLIAHLTSSDNQVICHQVEVKFV